MDIELRHLRYVVAVADAGTTVEAARRLRVAQPSLSQQIRAVEQRLGVPLFRRGPRGMAPTPAGEAFVAGARRTLAELDAAVAAARDAPVPVRVGVCAGVPTGLLTEVGSALHRTSTDISYEPHDSAQQAELLRRGDLAYGILRPPVDDDGLTLLPVREEPLGVVVPPGHPLAGAAVDWPALAGYRLLWFPDSRAPGYAAAVLAHLAAHGWTPRTQVAQYRGHALFVHALSAAADLVALRPRDAVASSTELVWVPFADDPPREVLALAARTDGPWAAHLVDLTRRRPTERENP